MLIPTFSFSVKAESKEEIREEDGLIRPVLDRDDAYLSEFEITKIVDGTESFDTSEDPKDPSYKDRPGNDENGTNRKVRTFDEITYNLSYHTAVTDEYYYEKGAIEFEFLLPLLPSEAVWDTTAMSWMDYGWTVVTEERTYDFDADGKKETRTCQVLKGKRTLVKSVTNPTAIPGQGTLMAVIKVKAMKNGDRVSPVLTVWMEHNRAGTEVLGSEGSKPTENEQICENHGKKEHQTVQADPVTVTAEPRYNVQLKQGEDSYNQTIGGTYDLNQGNEKALDKDKGRVTGTTMGYGITLQLYNDKGKDLKGIELPSGPITFDLELSTVFVPAQKTLTDKEKEYVSRNYEPVVLTFGPHVTNGRTADERDIGENTSYIVYGGPENSALSWDEEGSNTCYRGGNWSAAKKGSRISVTVSDYEIDTEKFPNTDLGNSNLTATYFNYKNGVQNIGCFSAGMIYIITPSYNNGTTDPERKNMQILDDLGVSDGTFHTTIKDVRLRAESLSGQKLKAAEDASNQTGPKTDQNGQGFSDDSVTSVFYLNRPGDRSYRIQYSKADGWGGEAETDPLGRRYPVKNGTWGNGKDALVRGHECAIMNGFLNVENGDMNNRMFAANVLTKFDAEAVELSGKSSVGTWVRAANFESVILYAAKKDGKNWKDDEEMLTAKMEDLCYFRSLQELEKSGCQCVGAMTEYRPVDGDYRNIRKVLQGAMLYSQIEGKVRMTAVPGKVYQTVLAAKAWCGRDYMEAVEKGMIPSMAENDPADPIVLPKATYTEYRPYEKSRYDESGYAGGHTGNYNYGDSLYILDTSPGITKHIEQKENGSEKQIYHVSDGQRYVDYVLTPVFDELSGSQNVDTTITVTDVLPKAMSYVPGSGYLGGTYIQNEEPGRTGQIEDGTQEEPEMVQNRDGTVSLIWKFVNVKSGDTLPQIHYSAQIGTPGDNEHDVKNNDDILNIARIRSERDRRDYNESSGNESRKGIRISKLEGSAPSKIPDQKFHDITDAAGYTINVGNNSNNNMEKQLIMDTMPINEDDRGNDFHGVVQLETLRIDPDKIGNLRTWTCYYTEDTAVKNTTAKDYQYEAIKNTQNSQVNGKVITWKKAEIDTDGNIPGLSGKSPTAIAWLGDLKGEKTLSVQCKLRIQGAKGGDVIVNGVSHGKDETAKPKVYFVDRKISGLAWLDENENGQREADEKLLGGIKVYLLRKNAAGSYEAVKNEDGSMRCTETAEKDGSYSFEDLPAGVYGVQFASGTTILDQFVPTKENIGDDATDSDGMEIHDLILPEAKDMLTAHFESRYNDAGFYYKKGSITIQKMDQKGNRLNGAGFKLERKAQNGSWETCTESETDEQGVIKMENLSRGTYRITEIKTAKGYQLLKEPIKVTIPYVMNEKGDKDPAYEENGKYYYLDLTYKVKNDKAFALPLSGGSGHKRLYGAGILLILLGAGYAGMIYRRKMN